MSDVESGFHLLEVRAAVAMATRVAGFGFHVVLVEAWSGKNVSNSTQLG
jgi:hypothetical protein